MSRFEDIGLHRDSPITKVEAHAQVKPVWIEAGMGMVVLNRKTAASLVVLSNDRLLSLSLLPAGQKGIVKGMLSEPDNLFHPYRDTGDLAPGMAVERIKDLPQARFTLQAPNGQFKNISLGATAHVWGRYGGKSIQLASVPLGRMFMIESFSSTGVRDRFNAWGMGKATKLRLKAILPVDPKVPYMRIEGPVQEILLSWADANSIYVRACDICWSCGACMTTGE